MNLHNKGPYTVRDLAARAVKKMTCTRHQFGLRQRGQALTEFLVIAFAMLPLFLLMPMIGKYQDITHASTMASRYAAFDATVRHDASNSFKPETQLASEVRRRFFSTPDAPIKTDDLAGDFKAHQNLFWRDPTGRPLIARFADINVSFGENNAPQHAQAFSNASDGAPFYEHREFGLFAKGIYRANVAVPLINLPAGIKSYEPFDQINLLMHRQTSLVIDPWTSDSPARTEERFVARAPLNPAIGSIKSLLALAIPVFDLAEVSAPEFNNLEKWRDVVPQDRLHP